MPYFILPKGETATRINFDLTTLDAPDNRRSTFWRDISDAPPHTLCRSCGLPPTDRALYARSSYFCEPCALEGMQWRTALEKADKENLDTPDWPACSHACYATRDAAARDLIDGGKVKTHALVFRPSTAELRNWQHREAARLQSGEYMPTPWALRDSHPIHHAHLSVVKSGYVAFTRDVEAGVNDKQTRMRPGRYLQEFYKDQFTTTEIAEYVAQCAAMSATTAFSLATTADDITAIYCGGQGPQSCMASKTPPEYSWQKAYESGKLPLHPCAVYAGGDLALAYLGVIGGVISQRGFVWPERKIHGRIYGTGPLAHLLKRSGYVEGSFKGARLRAILIEDGYITPYVDRFVTAGEYGADSANVDASDKWLVLQGKHSGDILLDHTNGYSGDVDLGRETLECVNCCGDIRAGDDYSDDGDIYCSTCYNDAFAYCAFCDATVGRDDAAEMVHGATWCNGCIERETRTCEECSETWIECLLPRATQRARAARNVADYCLGCAEHMRVCPDCHEAYDLREHDTCPCGAVPRCPDTLPLPIYATSDGYICGMDVARYQDVLGAEFEVWHVYRPGVPVTAHEHYDSYSPERQRGNNSITCNLSRNADGVYRADYASAVQACERLTRDHGNTAIYQIVYVMPTSAEVPIHATA